MIYFTTKIKNISRILRVSELNTKLSIAAFIQLNSVNDKLTTNVRFRYNPREGTDLYIVYDERFHTNRYREQPLMPVSSNRMVLLKYTYAFSI